VSKPRTIVVFVCPAFNTSEPRSYFLNPESYGDDVARALIATLRARGITTDDEPDQEDFGWYFDFSVGEMSHCFVLGYRLASGDEPGVWVGTVERERGFFGSLLGRRKAGIRPEALKAIHNAVAALPEVGAISWFAAGDAF
jgi:hypothetical protein